MLHPLSCGDETCVQFFGRRIFLDQLTSLLDEALHTMTFLAVRAFSERLEDPIQARDMFFGLTKMGFKGHSQIF